jgi:hypothetical protein
MYEADDPWKTVEGSSRETPGEFTASVPGLDPESEHEFRAVVQHPKITLRGRAATLERPEAGPR